MAERRRGPTSGGWRDNTVAAVVDHLPDFLFYVNGQTHGQVLQNKFLLRSDVRVHWPLFSADRAITPSGGIKLSPSRVCYAIIRTYSPAGPKPKALVEDRNVIELGERALDVMVTGSDRRRTMMKAHVDIKSRSEDLISDKWGVKITIASGFQCKDGNISLGTVSMSTPANRTPLLALNVTNDSLGDVALESCYLLFEHHGFAIQKSLIPCPLTIGSSAKHRVFVSCVVDQLGVRRDWFVFEFKAPGGEKFIIVRFLSVQFTDDVTSDPALQAIRPFVPKPVKILKTTNEDIVDGIRPDNPSCSLLDTNVNPLHVHNEASVKRELLPGLFVDKYSRTGYSVGKHLNSGQTRLLEQKLSVANYKQKLLLMLLLEHRQEEVDIHNYDMPRATMEQANRYLALKVPGLAENRPSLLRGDNLLAKKPHGSRRFRGYVHRVQQDDVLLQFNRGFHDSFIKNEVFEIELCINPFSWWLKNRAIALSDVALASGLLFPNTESLVNVDAPKISRFYDTKLQSNPEQIQAVHQIVAGSSGKAAHLIFGPPGTGKTTTLVEAIKQVMHFNKECRILACTPSNAAADWVTTHLLKHVQKMDILRLNALSRRPESFTDDKVMDVSCSADGLFYFPNLEKIRKYRIVVCTVTTAGRLVSAGMPRGHFSHVFVDECGHALEAECVIPLSTLVQHGKTQVVLAGDPHQLGPIVRSPQAIKYGLSTSLLERLMKDCDLYQRHVVDGASRYDPRAVTKLLRNYRSHPSIIKVPNKAFYDDELQVFADQMGREMLCDWEYLPSAAKKSRFPIIFHGIEGVDKREGDSPSFFNLEEVSQVRDYVDKLRASRRPQISASQIGVISPYHKQVMKIRQTLRGKGHDSVKVGSVEEFQGQERTVIIISAVRSQPEYLSMDKTFKLGFLSNEKRFNVAITRAMALLIVIGNPFILKHDPLWSTFLNFCIDNGGYTGCNYTYSDEASFREKMENLSLRSGAQTAAAAAAALAAGKADGDADLREDPGWRREE